MVLRNLNRHSKPLGPLKSVDLFRNSIIFRKLFSGDHRTIFDHVREVSSRILVPDTCNLHTGKVLLEDKLSELKQFRGIGIPIEFGGSEGFQGIVSSVILHQNLAYGSASSAAFFDGNGLFATPLILAGTPEQKRFYLTKLANGEIVGCYGLSDTQCGSDLANMKSLRVSHSDMQYVLSGSKTFVTNAPIADHAIVFARSGEEKRHLTAFIVPRKSASTNGFQAENPMEKLGWRASHTSIISLDDVVVPKDNMVGVFGDGFRIAVTTLAYGRLKIAAEALGLMERAVDETLNFIDGRDGVDGSLNTRDVVRYQVAEMAQLMQAVRDTVYATAFLAEQIEDDKVVPFSIEAASAKSFAARSLRRVLELALPLHGGYGFTHEYPISVIHSDAPLYMTGEGADNVLLISNGATIIGAK